MTSTTDNPKRECRSRPDFETVVPPGQPVARCPYCRRPFPAERLRNVHIGLEHPSRLDAEERSAFEAAYEAETLELRRFRLVALGTIVAIYFCTLFAYAIVT